MMSNTRVFISSTSLDLQDYRQAAFRAIQSLGGYSDDMIYWSADERGGATLSADRVRQSDVLVLLLAHRYGHVPDGSSYSVTEMEFRTARAADIPVLAFIIDDEVPWPPKFVERERAAEMARFKELVSQEVTWRKFRSADELMALVTQSLVSLAPRLQQRRSRTGRAFKGSARIVSAPAELRSTPDASVLVGTAEDGLPLVLQVTRSQDVRSLLQLIADAVARPGVEPPEAMFKTFQQSLEQYSRQTWASERVFPVAGRDGVSRYMYVTSSTLSTLFRPLFAAMLDAPAAHQSRPPRLTAKSDSVVLNVGGSSITTLHVADSHPVKALQSVGGRNRFLGVSLDDSTVRSVGSQGSQWVEWRPFFFESLAAHAPEGRFRLWRSRARTKKPVDGSLKHYVETLENEAFDVASESGSVSLETRFIVSREAVGRLILAIAALVERSHGSGFIHGDLKASNVVLTPECPTLIDDFELREGEIAPGWTPDWSAPEQVLGNPVTPGADIYPLGIMVARLLGGHLVGEVRKFRTMPIVDGRDEFDIFYDPFVHVEPDQASVDTKGLRAWLSFTRACLAFNPDKRIESAAAFARTLRTLLEESPLKGDLVVTVPGELVVARLPDGTDRVVRMLGDAHPADAGVVPHPSAPPPPPPPPVRADRDV